MSYFSPVLNLSSTLASSFRDVVKQTFHHNLADPTVTKLANFSESFGGRLGRKIAWEASKNEKQLGALHQAHTGDELASTSAKEYVDSNALGRQVIEEFARGFDMRPYDFDASVSLNTLPDQGGYSIKDVHSRLKRTFGLTIPKMTHFKYAKDENDNPVALLDFPRFETANDYIREIMKQRENKRETGT